MNQLPLLLRREFWENRGGFMYTPFVLSCVLVSFAILILIFSTTHDGDHVILKKLTSEFAAYNGPEKSYILNSALYGMSMIFNSFMFIVIFFYLIGSLYDDRRDKSILFWKSLPLSDGMTVVSKYLSATLTAPAFTLLAIIATQLIFLVGATLILWYAGESASSALWSHTALISIWINLILAYAVQALWMAPVYSWLLFVSAFAPRLPFLWAVLTPLMSYFLYKINQMITQLDYAQLPFEEIIVKRIAGVIPITLTLFDSASNFSLDINNSNDSNALSHMLDASALLKVFLSADLAWGLLFSAPLFAGAIALRRYKNET